jgi:hypothetical protein
VVGAFFNSHDVFAQEYSQLRRSVNIWAAPFGANASSSCSARDFSDSAISPIVGVVDGRVIVHTEDFNDCAAIALGGGGTVNVSTGSRDRQERPEVIFVHESGHFLHGQG